MKTILPILFTLLFFSCKKDKEPYQPVQLSPELTNNEDSIHKYLPGNWEWVEDRMITREGYVYYTPKTQGYRDYMALSGDTVVFNRLGREAFVSRFTEALVRRFKIVPEKEITRWPEDEHPMLVTYDFVAGTYSSAYRVYISKDQLILATNYRNETPDRIYKRKN